MREHETSLRQQRVSRSCCGTTRPPLPRGSLVQRPGGIGLRPVLSRHQDFLSPVADPLSYVSKSLLVWMQESFLRWIKEDDSEKNREWVEGIAQAFQDGLAGDL